MAQRIGWHGGWRAGLLAALLVTVALSGGGCTLLGLGAYFFAGDQDKQVQVKAEYTGLDGQTVVVMVLADQDTLFESPNATASVCTALSAEIAASVPSATVLSPEVSLGYQTLHPYWHTMPYRDLLEELDVDRLVWVELVQYTSHAPGDPYLRRGTLLANLVVVEATEPDTLAYQSTVQVHYPPNRPLGTIDLDRGTIERGMVRAFSQRVVRLFTDHTMRRRN